MIIVILIAFILKKSIIFVCKAKILVRTNLGGPPNLEIV